MNRTAKSAIIVVSMLLCGAQIARARGTGGAHPSEGSHPSNTAHSGATYHGSSGEAYHGTGGMSAVHGSEGTAVKGPGGNTYAHEAKGAPATPAASTHATTSSPGATKYSAAHTNLPTDAGYAAHPVAAASAATTAAANHQTVAVNPNTAAATGAAVRNSAAGYGAPPAAWAAAAAPGLAWGAAAWPAVGATVGIAATAQPVPYNYGANVTYQGNQVYFGNQPAATADQYYQQAATLAQSAPAADPKTPDWTPLGAFALVQQEQSEPHYILHLAVNKAGTIGGNYADVVSGTDLPIHGAVDKKTQRVAWTVGNNKNTVAETGLYNLTQDEAPVLIHTGKDKTQQWLLVRLKQPQQR